MTLSGLWNEVRRALDRQGIANFSVWSIQDFLFCYGEYLNSSSSANGVARALPDAFLIRSLEEMDALAAQAGESTDTAETVTLP